MWWDHCAPFGLSELHPVPGCGQLQRPWKYHLWNWSQVCGKGQTLAGFVFYLIKQTVIFVFLLLYWVFYFVTAFSQFYWSPFCSLFKNSSSVENIQPHLFASGDLVPVCLCGVDLYSDSKNTDYFLGLTLNEFVMTSFPVSQRQWSKDN